jgi:hypothetical protein
LRIENYELNGSNSIVVVVMVVIVVGFRHGGQVSLLQNLGITRIIFISWQLGFFCNQSHGDGILVARGFNPGLVDVQPVPRDVAVNIFGD